MKNDDNKIEEINDNEEDKNNPPKFYFPIGALIAIGVIIILMIACIIVIVNL